MLPSARRHGQFRRDLYLGEAHDSGRISAQYDNGVLTLSVPLAESALFPPHHSRPALFPGLLTQS